MAEQEHHLASIDRVPYSGKLCSGSPIAQQPLLLLAELASELSNVTDFEALQRILTRQLRWIVDFDQCTLGVRSEYLDNASSREESISSRLAPEYLLFEITSPSKAKGIPPQKILIKEGWPGRVLIDSKPYFIEDLAQLPPLIISPSNAHWGIASKARSLMLLPLRIGERTIGSLNFSSNKIGAYSITWRNLASLLAAQVGGQLGSVLTQVQLKSAYEFRELAFEYQVQELTLQLQQDLDFEARLKRITDKVRDSLDESQIVQVSVQELALGLSVACCNMSLYNLDQGTSTICYEYSTFIPASQGRIVQTADFPELYRQLLEKQYFQFCLVVPNPNWGQVAILACPISDDQGVLGDLWLINQKNHVFNKLEIRLVQQVTKQCAIAIRQARLYQAAQAQVEKLEKLNQLKDDFLSTVSHELRTPMSNMKMSIHLLKIAPTAERRERYLKVLQTECDREIELINTLLDLQRLEAAAYLISFETLSLQDWLLDIIEPFQGRIQAYQQVLHVDLPASLHPISSDSTSLRRILAELLNNACKYTPVGGKITLGVCYKSHLLAMPLSQDPVFIFTISNEAEISPMELPRIFEKFYRGSNSNVSRQGGTGLGLPLVQKLVEQLQGSIQVESTGGWTKFTVQLPTHAPYMVSKISSQH